MPPMTLSFQNQSPLLFSIPHPKLPHQDPWDIPSIHWIHHVILICTSWNHMVEQRIINSWKSIHLKKQLQRNDQYLNVSLDWSCWLHHLQLLFEARLEPPSLQVLVWRRSQLFSNQFISNVWTKSMECTTQNIRPCNCKNSPFAKCHWIHTALSAPIQLPMIFSTHNLNRSPVSEEAFSPLKTLNQMPRNRTSTYIVSVPGHWPTYNKI